MKLNIKYAPDQSVYIKELKKKGVVLSIFINNAAKITYNVRFFHDFNAKEIYFYEDELSENEEEVKAGFNT